MGHYFGLYHTFETDFGLELEDGSNCDVTGDLVCDTPADPYIHPDTMSKYVDGCTFIFMGKDANGAFYNPHTTNIMSYYPCECGRFTTWTVFKNGRNLSGSNWHVVMKKVYIIIDRRMYCFLNWSCAGCALVSVLQFRPFVKSCKDWRL